MNRMSQLTTQGGRCPERAAQSAGHWIPDVLYLFIYLFIYVFIYWKLVAPSTAQGHLRAYTWRYLRHVQQWTSNWRRREGLLSSDHRWRWTLHWASHWTHHLKNKSAAKGTDDYIIEINLLGKGPFTRTGFPTFQISHLYNYRRITFYIYTVNANTGTNKSAQYFF